MRLARFLRVAALIAGGAGLGMATAVAVSSVPGCNDNSTGCCMICHGTCACGDQCVPCGQICGKPKGCACTEETAAQLEPDAR
jgi:hypothetical protein